MRDGSLDNLQITVCMLNRLINTADFCYWGIVYCLLMCIAACVCMCFTMFWCVQWCMFKQLSEQHTEEWWRRTDTLKSPSLSYQTSCVLRDWWDKVWHLWLFSFLSFARDFIYTTHNHARIVSGNLWVMYSNLPNHRLALACFCFHRNR